MDGGSVGSAFFQPNRSHYRPGSKALNGKASSASLDEGAWFPSNFAYEPTNMDISRQGKGRVT
jgi:hypothetical protein